MKSIKFALLSIIIFLFIWEILVFSLHTPLFPSIVGVFISLIRMVITISLYENLLASILLVLKGFLYSSVVALFTSILCYKNNFINKTILPFHEFIRYIPVPAFVPLCAALFGVEDTTKVALIFIGTYFQQVFMFIADFCAPKPEIEESARILGITGISLMFKVNLPASLPNIFDTLRITFAWAWSYLLVAEVVNARKGIGYLVLQSYRVLNMKRLIALLIIIGIFGIFADIIFRKVKKISCPWAKNEY